MQFPACDTNSSETTMLIVLERYDEIFQENRLSRKITERTPLL